MPKDLFVILTCFTITWWRNSRFLAEYFNDNRACISVCAAKIFCFSEWCFRPIAQNMRCVAGTSCGQLADKLDQLLCWKATAILQFLFLGSSTNSCDVSKMFTDPSFPNFLGNFVSACKFMKFKWGCVFVLSSSFPQTVFAGVLFCLFFPVFLDLYLCDEKLLCI